MRRIKIGKGRDWCVVEGINESVVWGVLVLISEIILKFGFVEVIIINKVVISVLWFTGIKKRERPSSPSFLVASYYLVSYFLFLFHAYAAPKPMRRSAPLPRGAGWSPVSP
jgi:hypothetical protein